MAVVTTKAIFWLCQNSLSTDEQGGSAVDDGAILAALLSFLS